MTQHMLPPCATTCRFGGFIGCTNYAAEDPAQKCSYVRPLQVTGMPCHECFLCMPHARQAALCWCFPWCFCATFCVLGCAHPYVTAKPFITCHLQVHFQCSHARVILCMFGTVMWPAAASGEEGSMDPDAAASSSTLTRYLGSHPETGKQLCIDYVPFSDFQYITAVSVHCTVWCTTIAPNLSTSHESSKLEWQRPRFRCLPCNHTCSLSIDVKLAWTWCIMHV